MSLNATLRRSALVFSLALLVASCKPREPRTTAAAPSPWHVSRGERFKTGKVAYDEYFSSVFELQSELANVPDDRKAARSTLLQTLGLPPTASPERLIEALDQRSRGLRQAGGRIVVNNTTAQVEKGSADDKSLAQGLSSCLLGEVQIMTRMQKMPERVESLLQIAEALAGSIDSDFGASERGEVEGELEASRSALRALINASKTAANTSTSYVEELIVAATDAKPTEPPNSPPTAPSKPKSSGVSKPKSSGAGPAKPPAKPEDDFNP